MRLRFSQTWGKDEPLTAVIREALNLAIPPRYRDGLLVKVLYFTSLASKRRWRYRGNYRLAVVHGLYPNEYGYKAVITMKLPRDLSIEKTVHFVGHEAGHHVSYAMTRRFGEKTADKYADKVVEKWTKRRDRKVEL